MFRDAPRSGGEGPKRARRGGGLDPERIVEQGVRCGLSLHDAWRVSPKALALAAKGRQEAALDDLEQRVLAAYAGQWFARQKVLDETKLQQLLPRRGKAERRTLESELARWDNWAKGVSRRFERVERARLAKETVI